MLTFFVEGDPVAQPRPRACIRGTHASVYDPGTADEWKARVKNVAALEYTGTVLTGPIRVTLLFFFKRPQAHYRTNGELKPKAPLHHVQKPDTDNLAKAVLDALVDHGTIQDDALIVSLTVAKRWAMTKPGCTISIEKELP